MRGTQGAQGGARGCRFFLDGVKEVQGGEKVQVGATGTGSTSGRKVRGGEA